MNRSTPSRTTHRVRLITALTSFAILTGASVGAHQANAERGDLGGTKILRLAANSPLRLHPAPRPVPEIRFLDADGKPLTLANFRGKVVLLNVWATWCPPCRKEMPSLDRLQAKLGGADFEVVALSIDRGGIFVVQEFFKEADVEALAFYIDPSVEVMSRLGIVGLPTTLLIDRSGREIGRWVGPAEWDQPEVVQFIRSHLASPRPR